MAFKISATASQQQRHAPHRKPAQRNLAAFQDDDDDEEEQQHEHTQQGSSTEAAAGSSAQAAAVASWMDKGSVLAEQGDAAAALRCWDQALLLEPDNGRVHEMRAQVLNTAGRAFEAVQAAQQAVALCATWPEAHLTLARCQLNFGEPVLALNSYQAAAKLQPDHPDVAAEMPTAQMYAKLHATQQQQQPGSRAHVVEHMPPAEPPGEAAAAAVDDLEAGIDAVLAGAVDAANNQSADDETDSMQVEEG